MNTSLFFISGYSKCLLIILLSGWIFIGCSRSDQQNRNNMSGGQMGKMDTVKPASGYHGVDTTSIRTGTIDLHAIDKNHDGKVYQDQMHWNVISDAPGQCPICGMDLVQVTLEQARKNLTEHGYQVK